MLATLRVHGQLIAAGDELTRPVGLSSARWQVLGVVEHGPVSVADIAKTMGLARQSVQETADALERAGFVRFEANPHHRRAKLLSLTPQGTAALDVVIAGQRAWATRLARAASLDDLEAATRVLGAIKDALDADAAAGGQPERVPAVGAAGR